MPDAHKGKPHIKSNILAHDGMQCSQVRDGWWRVQPDGQEGRDCCEGPAFRFTCIIKNIIGRREYGECTWGECSWWINRSASAEEGLQKLADDAELMEGRECHVS